MPLTGAPVKTHSQIVIRPIAKASRRHTEDADMQPLPAEPTPKPSPAEPTPKPASKAQLLAPLGPPVRLALPAPLARQALPAPPPVPPNKAMPRLRRSHNKLARSPLRPKQPSYPPPPWQPSRGGTRPTSRSRSRSGTRPTSSSSVPRPTSSSSAPRPTMSPTMLADEMLEAPGAGHHPECTSGAGNCIGSTESRLVRHLYKANRGDLYCEPCFDSFYEKNSKLKGEFVVDWY